MDTADSAAHPLAAVLFVALMVASAVAAGLIADKKGHSGLGFFFVSLFFLGPVGVVWALLAAPPKKDRLNRQQKQSRVTNPLVVASSGSATKTCPDCAETILAAARVCKHCGYRFAPIAES